MFDIFRKAIALVALATVTACASIGPGSRDPAPRFGVSLGTGDTTGRYATTNGPVSTADAAVLLRPADDGSHTTVPVNAANPLPTSACPNATIGSSSPSCGNAISIDVAGTARKWAGVSVGGVYMPTVNIGALNGTSSCSPNLGSGAVGDCTQRIVTSSDSVIGQSGTWTVQPGNTPNTSPWLFSPQAATSGGTTNCFLQLANSTNATVCKASAGQVYDLVLSNNSANIAYLKIYNKATTPTCNSDTVVFETAIPASTSGAGSNVTIPVGRAFSAGISFCVTNGIAASDNTAVAAGAFLVNIGYK